MTVSILLSTMIYPPLAVPVNIRYQFDLDTIVYLEHALHIIVIELK